MIVGKRGSSDSSDSTCSHPLTSPLPHLQDHGIQGHGLGVPHVPPCPSRPPRPLRPPTSPPLRGDVKSDLQTAVSALTAGSGKKSLVALLVRGDLNFLAASYNWDLYSVSDSGQTGIHVLLSQTGERRRIAILSPLALTKPDADFDSARCRIDI